MQIHDVQELSRGTLRVAMTPTFTAYLAGPLVETFNSHHPGITLTIQLMPQERMETLLNDDALNVGIAFDEVRSPDIEGQTLLSESLALMVGKSHPYAKFRRPITLEDFNREVLVLLNTEFATRMQIDRHWRQLGAAPRIAIEVNSISAIVEIVRGGRLATVLPAAIAREQTGLFPVPLEFAAPERSPCCYSARGRTGQLPREPSSRSRSRRTGTRERHGVTGAFALISRPITPSFWASDCCVYRKPYPS